MGKKVLTTLNDPVMTQGHKIQISVALCMRGCDCDLLDHKVNSLGWMNWKGQQSTKTCKHRTRHYVLKKSKTYTEMEILLTNTLKTRSIMKL
jgi:hypothetical protein